jgi:hypothetical protein
VILLDASVALQVTTGGAGPVNVHCSYVDITGQGQGALVGPQPVDTVIAAPSTVIVTPSPAAGTERSLQYISVENAGGVPIAITVLRSNGTVLRSLTLEPTDSLVYNESSGWDTYDGGLALLSAV